MLAASFTLAAFVIRDKPYIEDHIRLVGPGIALPIATAIFALVASAPFSVTDALAIMNGALFGPWWGSAVDAVGIVFAAMLGYWINRHASHLMDLEAMLAKLPHWVKRFRIGSPMFLITVRVIPGFGGTVATASAAALRVPVWIHVLTMSVVAIPICVALTIGGDRLTTLFHTAERRAHTYIIHHRPHWHLRHRVPHAPIAPTQ